MPESALTTDRVGDLPEGEFDELLAEEPRFFPKPAEREYRLSGSGDNLRVFDLITKRPVSYRSIEIADRAAIVKPYEVGEGADAERTLMAELLDHRVLSDAEVQFLARRRDAGDPQAFDIIIEHNYRLVVDRALRKQSLTVELIDRFQEGVKGLHRATEKFDPEKGFRFSTYATWWIDQSISRMLMDFGRTIRVPIHMHEKHATARHSETELLQELKREPTKEELSAASKVKPEDLANIERAISLRSLDEPWGRLDGDDGSSRYDMIADPGAEDELEATQSLIVLTELMEVLTDQERAIITQYYGIGELEEDTLVGVADRHDISRDQVKRIIHQGTKRMRAHAQLSSVELEAREFRTQIERENELINSAPAPVAAKPLVPPEPPLPDDAPQFVRRRGGGMLKRYAKPKVDLPPDAGRAEALEMANRTRQRMAEYKRQLKAGELTLPDALANEELSPMKLRSLLKTMNGVGKVRLDKAFRALGFTNDVLVGALTEAGRKSILERFPHRSKPRPKSAGSGSSDQMVKALAEANRIRLHRAALKRSLSTGEVGIADILNEETMATELVYAVLESLPGNKGNERMKRLVRDTAISGQLTVMNLTERQREVLIANVAREMERHAKAQAARQRALLA